MTKYIERPPEFDPQVPLNESLAYEELDWSSIPDMLSPGSLVKVEPLSARNVYVFECTAADFRNLFGDSALGYLAQYNFDENGDMTQLESPQPATIKLSKTTPRVIFEFEEEGKRIRLNPSESKITQVFSRTLTDQLKQQWPYQENIQSFKDPVAQRTVQNVIEYLQDAAKTLDRPPLAVAAELIMRDLIIED